MKNKAKCKLCESIIESFYEYDYVSCKCGEIAVYGGAGMYCEFKNENNFLRMDENGAEMSIKYLSKDDEHKKNDSPTNPPEEISRDELIYSLQQFVEATEKSPNHEKYSYVTQIMLSDCILTILNILKKG
jgi:hypothetical protein